MPCFQGCLLGQQPEILSVSVHDPTAPAVPSSHHSAVAWLLPFPSDQGLLESSCRRRLIPTPAHMLWAASEHSRRGRVCGEAQPWSLCALRLSAVLAAAGSVALPPCPLLPGPLLPSLLLPSLLLPGPLIFAASGQTPQENHPPLSWSRRPLHKYEHQINTETFSSGWSGDRYILKTSLLQSHGLQVKRRLWITLIYLLANINA